MLVLGPSSRQVSIIQQENKVSLRLEKIEKVPCVNCLRPNAARLQLGVEGENGQNGARNFDRKKWSRRLLMHHPQCRSWLLSGVSFFIFLHSTHSSGFRRLTQYALWGWRAADSELYCIWGAAWCSAIGCSIDTINHWDHALAPARNLKAFLGYKSRLVLSTALTSQVLRPTRQFQKNEWIYKQSTIRDDCIFHPGKIPYILLLKIWILPPPVSQKS